MQNIGDCYDFIKTVTDKNTSGGFLSPGEVSNWLDAGQNALYGHYVPLKIAGDDVGYSALIPFKTSSPLTSGSTGILTYPDDWNMTEAIYLGNISYNTVLHDELQEALASVLYPIATNPRYIEEAGGVQLYPAELTNVSFHYLSKPTTPVIGGTVSGNEFIYDPNTSTQLQFTQPYWFKIIENALFFAGINLSSEQIQSAYQVYNQQTKRGEGQ